MINATTPCYNEIAYLAALVCNVPIATVCMVDKDRQWFKSHYGMDETETSRDIAFCAHAILDDKPFVVPDATKDDRFHDNPLVTESPGIQFYAGIPLELEPGINVGTLCVIDRKPRELTEQQMEGLLLLSQILVELLRLRIQLKDIENLRKVEAEFVAMVTHELRTPLFSIMGSLSMLEDPETVDAAVSKKLLNRAYKGSEHLSQIINDILDVTKLNAGKFTIRKTENNINECIRNTVDLLSDYFREKGVKLELNLDESIPAFSFDPDRIRQVINNLVSNAVKFSNENGKVIITSAIKNNECKISVQDFGDGIPEDKKGNIFTKFSQIQAKKIPGTGLGLNISKQIIEMHGGSIGFESEEGKGSTFFFSLIV